MLMNPSQSGKCADMPLSQSKITMEQILESVKDQVCLSPADHINMDLLEKEQTFPLFTEMASQVSMDDGLAVLDLGKDFQSSFMENASSSDITCINSYLDDICLLEDVTQLTLPVVNDTTAENPVDSSLQLCQMESSTDVTNSTTSVTDHKQIVELSHTVNLYELICSGTINQLDQNETFHNLQTLLEESAYADSSSSVFETVTLHAVKESPVLVELVNCESPSTCCSTTEVKCDGQDVESAVNNSPANIPKIKTSTGPKSTHDKYMEMRRKNNIASRRSRQARKEKEHALELKAVEIEKENCILKTKVKKLEKQRDALKKYLINVVSSK